MSSIHNTQWCLLKAPGVTYERLLPICLTLFSCSSCHSVCMSAAAADRSLSCPPLQPTPLPSTPHHHFREPEKWLSYARLLRYQKGCDPVTPRADLPDLNVTVSPPPTENKNKSYHAPPRLIERKESPYINVVLWQSSIHMTCDFSNRVCLTLTTERWRRAGCPSLASPALISFPLHLSPHSSLCAQLNKQARGGFPLWKPWKMARTFSPISGISIWRRHSCSHCPPRPISVCVLVSLCCRDGFHSPLATMRLAHQVDSIRIDNPFQ